MHERINFNALTCESKRFVLDIIEDAKKKLDCLSRGDDVKMLNYLPVDYESQYIIVHINAPFINKIPPIFVEDRRDAESILKEVREAFNSNIKLKQEIRDIIVQLNKLDKTYDEVLDKIYSLDPVDDYERIEKLREEAEKILIKIRALRG